MVFLLVIVILIIAKAIQGLLMGKSLGEVQKLRLG
jgi:hypothetical protein